MVKRSRVEKQVLNAQKGRDYSKGRPEERYDGADEPFQVPWAFLIVVLLAIWFIVLRPTAQR